MDLHGLHLVRFVGFQKSDFRNFFLRTDLSRREFVRPRFVTKKVSDVVNREEDQVAVRLKKGCLWNILYRREKAGVYIGAAGGPGCTVLNLKFGR